MTSRHVTVLSGNLSLDDGRALTTTVIHSFLTSLGWWVGNDRWNRDTFTEMTWEQAMAIELFRFMTVGGR